MINFKPELVRILKSILENVVETYPDDWASLPVVVYEEENNTPYVTTSGGESMSLLRYRIEIYSRTSTSALKTQINAKLTERGLTRSFSLDTNDLGGRRHTIMRFEGVIDYKTLKIFKPN